MNWNWWPCLEHTNPIIPSTRLKRKYTYVVEAMKPSVHDRKKKLNGTCRQPSVAAWMESNSKKKCSHEHKFNVAFSCVLDLVSLTMTFSTVHRFHSISIANMSLILCNGAINMKSWTNEVVTFDKLFLKHE